MPLLASLLETGDVHSTDKRRSKWKMLGFRNAETELIRKQKYGGEKKSRSKPNISLPTEVVL